MQQPWTLKVENFGRVKSAEIQAAPMVLLVGQNNTGKSYVASLAWGIMHNRDVFPEEIPSSKQYQECKELLVSHYEGKKEKLDRKFIKLLISFYNHFLQEKKDDIVQKIFSSKDLKIEKLLVDIKEDDILEPSIRWEAFKDLNIDKLLPDSLKPSTQWELVDDACVIGDCFYQVSSSFAKLKDEDFYSFIKQLTYNSLFGNFNFPVYLPASRTGFMLSYKSLMANLMETWGINKQVQSSFSLPVIRFLQHLNFAEYYNDNKDNEKIKFVEIANSLERDVLEGEIRQFPKPATGFYYVPEGKKKPLPFHITSSLVSELAPMIIFLKAKDQFANSIDSIIFEEPESHLHLKAQRYLAKSLIKLVNNKMPVWITTHSDIFFQQINNLIATNSERKEQLKELSYQDDEMIDPKDINAYQFNISEDGMSETVPLELTDDGFVIPTFNETIWELAKETMRVESGADDAE